MTYEAQLKARLDLNRQELARIKRRIDELQVEEQAAAAAKNFAAASMAARARYLQEDAYDVTEQRLRRIMRVS